MHKTNKKVLRYIYKHPYCEISITNPLYETVIYLCEQKYAAYFEGQNKDGYAENHIYYKVTHFGLDALSDCSWINPEFLTKQIALPIILSAVTTILTLIISTLFVPAF